MTEQSAGMLPSLALAAMAALAACALVRTYEHGNVAAMPQTCQEQLDSLYSQYYLLTAVLPSTITCTEIIQSNLANQAGVNCTADDTLRACFNVSGLDRLPACTRWHVMLVAPDLQHALPKTRCSVQCSTLPRPGSAWWPTASCSRWRRRATQQAAHATSLCRPTPGGCAWWALCCSTHPAVVERGHASADSAGQEGNYPNVVSA